jgi:hypothetical protein
MLRQKQITTTRQPGTASKAEVFEELIRKVLGVNVRLEAKKIDEKANSVKREDSENRARLAGAEGRAHLLGTPEGTGHATGHQGEFGVRLGMRG